MMQIQPQTETFRPPLLAEGPIQLLFEHASEPRKMQLLSWFQSAATVSGDEWCGISVLEAWRDNEVVVWGIFAGDELVWAFATIAIQMRSGKRVLEFAALGGKTGRLSHEDIREQMQTVERYAKAEGFHALRITGRPAWTRIFSDYHEVHRTIELSLHTEEVT